MAAMGLSTWLRATFSKASSAEPRSDTVPSTPVAPVAPETPDTLDARAAVHEAGHALVALRCTLVKSVVKITIGDVLRRGSGEIHYDLLEHHRDAEWCKLVIVLGGLTAEGMVYRNFRSVDQAGDLLKARSYAEEIVRLGLEPPWAPPPRDPKPPAFDRMFRTPLPVEEHAVLSAGYRKARDLLERHRGSHAELTSIVLSCRTVPETVIARWFGPRGFLRALGFATRGRFVG